MRDARDKNKADDEKRKVMIASVAHDLKTPLAVISGYAESLSDGMDDKDYTALILQKTEEMNSQVLTLVESSRNEIQSIGSIKESVLFGEFFKTEALKYEKLAQSKKLTFIVKGAPYVTVYANRQQLARVLQNLISNAIKYTPSGGKIVVKAKKVGKEVRVIVRDNGSGISGESLPFIFDKFYMEDKSRTVSGSNGLGLYITKEIVDDLSGVIEVKSKKDKGSRFVVRIPIEEGKIRRTITEAFDALPHNVKTFLYLFFGGILCSLYRFQKFYETRHRATLIAGILLYRCFCLAGQPTFSVLWCATESRLSQTKKVILLRSDIAYAVIFGVAKLWIFQKNKSKRHSRECRFCLKNVIFIICSYLLVLQLRKQRLRQP